MEFSGLVRKYRANRVLSDAERAQHLKQKRRLDIEPRYQLSVIKMNSTYLESVDKWFAWKGVLSGLSIVVLIMFVGSMGSIALHWLINAFDGTPRRHAPMILLANGVAMAVVTAMMAWATIWLWRKESFAYTHFPIRFNRKTRMVHVFRTDGTVLSVPWQEIFFTVVEIPGWREAEVQAHVLAPDRKTVVETFALSYVGMFLSDATARLGGKPAAGDYLRAHWEFIRRYMEEGPQSVAQGVQFCMAIDRRRESFRNGMERVFANIADFPWMLYWLLFPFCLAVSLFRFVAVWTSKIPQWPDEIEDSCKIERDDPYAIEGDAKGDRVAVYPEAARAEALIRGPTPL